MRERVVRLLREIQHSGFVDGYGSGETYSPEVGLCPVCSCGPNDGDGSGHADHCELAAVIRELEAQGA